MNKYSPPTPPFFNGVVQDAEGGEKIAFMHFYYVN
jgi:hypothetical protein